MAHAPETNTYVDQIRRDLLAGVVDFLKEPPQEGRVSLIAKDASPMSTVLMVGNTIIPAQSIDVSFCMGDTIRATVVVDIDDVVLAEVDLRDLIVVKSTRRRPRLLWRFVAWLRPEENQWPT